MTVETYIEARYLKVQEAIQLLNRLFGENTWRMEVSRQYELRKQGINVTLFRFSQTNMYSLSLELSLRFALREMLQVSYSCSFTVSRLTLLQDEKKSIMYNSD